MKNKNLIVVLLAVAIFFFVFQKPWVEPPPIVPPLEQGLFAWWQFSDASDSSGNNRNGVIAPDAMLDNNKLSITNSHAAFQADLKTPYFSSAELANLWDKSKANPNLVGQFGSVIQKGAEYWYYEVVAGTVKMKSSADGLVWGNQLTVLLGGGVGAWDEFIDVVSVFYDPGNAKPFQMLYRGHSASPIAYKIGRAESTDGLAWQRHANNPFDDTATEFGKNYDPTGVIKANGTYYAFVGGYGGHGATNLYTSQDLVNWVADSENPLFTGGEYCVFVFSYGGSFYLLVPWDSRDKQLVGDLGDHAILLYKDSSPTFHRSDRKYLGVAVLNDKPFDEEYLDTPSCITTDVSRSSFPTAPKIECLYWSKGTDNSTGNKWMTYNLASLAGLSVLPGIGGASSLYNKPQTVCAWINPSVSSTNQDFFSIADGHPYVGGPQVILGLSNANKLKVYGWLQSFYNYNYVVGNSVVPSNAWSHVCYAYDGTNFSLYLNGVLDSALVKGYNSSFAQKYAFVGAGYNADFKGLVDDVRVYNRVLSASEFAGLYALGAPV